MPVSGAVEAVQTFDPQVIIAQFAPVTREVIENAKSLEVIGCLRGGTENINVDAASKRKVLVFNNGGRTASASQNSRSPTCYLFRATSPRRIMP